MGIDLGQLRMTLLANDLATPALTRAQSSIQMIGQQAGQAQSAISALNPHVERLSVATERLASAGQGGNFLRGLPESLSHTASSSREAESELSKFEEGLKRVTERAVEWSLAWTGIEVVRRGFNELAEATVETNAELQHSTTIWSNLTVNMEQAVDITQQLKELSAGTQFSFEGLDRTAQNLVIMGTSAKDVTGLMHDLAAALTAAGGGDEALATIGDSLGVIEQTGVLTNRIFNQMTRDGIPAWDLLAKSIGTTRANTEQLVSEGLVSVPEFIAALHEYAQSNQIGDVLQKQSQTFDQASKSIRDSVELLTADAFKPMFAVINDGAIDLARFAKSDTVHAWALGAAVDLQKVIDIVRLIPAPVYEAVAGFLATREAVMLASGALTSLVKVYTEVTEWATKLYQALAGKAVVLEEAKAETAAAGATREHGSAQLVLAASTKEASASLIAYVAKLDEETIAAAAAAAAVSRLAEAQLAQGIASRSAVGVVPTQLQPALPGMEGQFAALEGATAQAGARVATMAAETAPATEAVEGLGAASAASAAEIGGMGAAIGLLGGPVGLIAAAVTALALAYTTNFLGMRDTTDTVTAKIADDANVLATALTNSLPKVEQSLGGFVTSLPSEIDKASAAMEAFAGAFVNSYAPKLDAFFSKAAADTKNFVSSIDLSGPKNFVEGYVGALDHATGASATLNSVVAEVGPHLGEIGQGFLQGAATSIPFVGGLLAAKDAAEGLQASVDKLKASQEAERQTMGGLADQTDGATSVTEKATDAHARSAQKMIDAADAANKLAEAQRTQAQHIQAAVDALGGESGIIEGQTKAYPAIQQLTAGIIAEQYALQDLDITARQAHQHITEMQQALNAELLPVDERIFGLQQKANAAQLAVDERRLAIAKSRPSYSPQAAAFTAQLEVTVAQEQKQRDYGQSIEDVRVAQQKAAIADAARSVAVDNLNAKLVAQQTLNADLTAAIQDYLTYTYQVRPTLVLVDPNQAAKMDQMYQQTLDQINANTELSKTDPIAADRNISNINRQVTAQKQATAYGIQNIQGIKKENQDAINAQLEGFNRLSGTAVAYGPGYGAAQNALPNITGIGSAVQVQANALGANTADAFSAGWASRTDDTQKIIQKAIQTGVIDAAMTTLGVKSPSKVFMGIANDTVAGLTTQITSRLADITSAGMAISKALIDGVQKGLSGADFGQMVVGAAGAAGGQYTGATPAAGDVGGWRQVLQAQAPSDLAGNTEFINDVLATGVAESGLNPNAVQKGGNGRGFFQFDTGGGLGTGLSNDQLFSESFQASKILPLFAEAFRNAPQGLSPADRAAFIANQVERPDDTGGVASARYRNAYLQVVGATGGSATPYGPGYGAVTSPTSGSARAAFGVGGGGVQLNLNGPLVEVVGGNLTPDDLKKAAYDALVQFMRAGLRPGAYASNSLPGSKGP